MTFDRQWPSVNLYCKSNVRRSITSAPRNTHAKIHSSSTWIICNKIALVGWWGTGYSMPRFPPELWNQIDNRMEGKPLSTNRNEGFQSRYEITLSNILTFKNVLGLILMFKCVQVEAWSSTFGALLGQLVDVEADTMPLGFSHGARQCWHL